MKSTLVNIDNNTLSLQYDEVKYLKSILSNKYSSKISNEIELWKTNKTKRAAISRSSFGENNNKNLKCKNKKLSIYIV